MTAAQAPGTSASNTWGVVESVRTFPDGGLDGIVDHPAPGSLLRSPRFKVIGWCRDVRSISATFGDSDVDIAGATVSDPRPDVAQALGRPELASTGFEITIDLLQLPQRFSLRLVAERHDGTHALLAAIAGTQSPLAPARAGPIAPLLLSAFGRSGTTWLMSLLRQLPQVVVAGAFPYEERPLAYWLHTLKVLTGRADHIRSANPDDFPLRAGWTGTNPSHADTEFAGAALDAWLASGFRSQAIEFVVGAVRDYYGAIAQDTGKPQACFFAEKAITFFDPITARRLFGDCREVVLVRDPRDTLASVLAFNRQRGVTAFDVDRFSDEESYVVSRGRYLELLLNRTIEDGALLLRYEDLIVDTQRTLRTLVEYLGLGLSEESLASAVLGAVANDPERVAHRTSRSPGRSVGRWREELSRETAGLYRRHMRELLGRLGYEG